MPARVLPLLLALLLSLSGAAQADVWTDALIADLAERKKPKEVLASYDKVFEAKHERAADACWRRVVIFAALGRKEPLKAELERMQKSFPKAYAAVVKKALADVDAFLASHDRKAAKKRLAKQKVSLNFNGTPLGECLAFFRDITGMNIAILPDVDESLKVSLRLKDISLENAFKLILAVDGDLEFKLVRGTVVIGKDLKSVRPKKWSKNEIQKNPDAVWTVISRTMTLNFDQTPISDVVGFVGDLTGVQVTLSKTVEGADPDVTLRLRNVRLDDILNLACGSHGLRWSVTKSGLRIDAR